MARNINSLNSDMGIIRQGSDSDKEKDYDKFLKDLKPKTPSTSSLPKDVVEGLNKTGRIMRGDVASDLPSAATLRGEEEKETTDTESATPLSVYDGNALIEEFNNTIAPYVRMDENEKRFYYNLISTSARTGRDAVAIAEDYLTVHAIANATGLDRAYVRENEDAISQFILGTPAERTFTWGANIINGWNQGWRQQDLLELKDEYRDLFADGYTDDDPEVKAKLEEIKKKKEEIQYNSDSTPHNFVVDALSNTVSQIPYMLSGGMGGLVGGGVGAALGAMVGAPSAGFNVGNYIGRFITYKGNFSGDSFYEMKQRGISTDTALSVSNVDGIINGLNESMLDSVANMATSLIPGLKAPSNLFSSALKRTAAKGGFRNFVASVGMYSLGQGTGEFLQEASESLTSSALFALAESMEGMDYSKNARKVFSDALEEGMAGFTTGVILGLPGSIVGGVQDVRKSISLAENAKATPSREMFVKDEANRGILKSISTYGSKLSNDEITKILSDMHDNYAGARAAKDKARSEVVKGSGTLSKEAQKLKKKERKARRLDSGRIRSQLSYNEDLGNSGEMLINFGDTIAQKEGGMAERYGSMRVSIDYDSNEATIESFNVKKGFEGEAVEMVRTGIEDYLSGYNVQWNTDSEFSSAVKQALEQSSADGTLNFRRTADKREAGRVAVKNEILKHMPNLSEGEAMANAATLDALAEGKGMSVDDFINKYMGGAIFVEGTDNDEFLKSKNARGAFRPLSMDEIAQGMKGVIYAGQKSDFSTFQHELFHFATRVNWEERKNLSKSLKNAAERFEDDLRAYINEHARIFSGKDIDRVIDLFKNLSEDRNWNTEEEEAITSLFEAYRSDPRNNSLNQEVKSVLQRIAHFMNKVYNGIRNNVRLNEEVAKSFDKIMGLDGSTSSSADIDNSGQDATNNGNTVLNQSDISESQEWQDTEKTLKADPSNFDEEGRPLAHNGELSNLPYREWVTVRTPSFIRWFGDWINDPESASKVVDENGEPLVVYHGSYNDFSVFDRTKTRANMDIQGNFFSPWYEDSEGYGPNVRAFFLNLRNPATSRDGYGALNTFRGQNNAGVRARELLVRKGFDGVNNDSEEYIAFEPNQIKSIDNLGSFDESNPDIYFQTIGYEGAAQLDNWARDNGMDAYHLLNLDAAVKMENDGVGAETIREVTGWERGIDGRWRTEIPDYISNFNWNVIEDKNSYRLEEIYNSPDLYIAYPSLANIRVVIDPTARTAGAFSPSEATIYLKEKPSVSSMVYDTDSSSTINTAQVLMHEVQHVIQGLEDFASGGNPSLSTSIREYAEQMRDMAKKEQQWMRAAVKERAKPYADITRAAENIQIMRRVQKDPRAVFKSWIWLEYGTWGIPRNREQQYAEAQKALNAASSDVQKIIEEGAAYQDDPEYADVFRGLDLNSGTITDSDLRNLINRSERRKRKIIDEIADQAYAESLTTRIDYFSSIASLDDYAMYKQLAGEVEARATSNKLDAPDTLKRLTEDFIDVRGKSPIVLRDSGRNGGYASYEVLYPQRIMYQAAFGDSNKADNVDSEIDSLSKEDIGKPNAYITFTEETPYIFKRMGLPDLPVVAYRDKLARSLFLDESEKHGHSDGMSKDIMKQIASKLSDPLYIFDSAAVENALVAVYSVLDKNNNPVMISLATNLIGNKNIEINLISSMYGKKINSLQNWINQGLLRYWNDLDKSKAALSVRLQLPSVVTASDEEALTVRLQLPSGVTSSDSRLLRKSELVNIDDLFVPNSPRMENMRENSYEAAKELAEEAHPQFVEDVENIRKLVGLSENDVSVRKTVKGRARSVEKAMADYQGDFSMILDYDGAMLSFDSLTFAGNAWEKVKETYGDRIVKDKHLRTALGYEDFKINIRMDNGSVSEIQFLAKNTLAVKNGIGHKIYEAFRTIEDLQNRGTENLQSLREVLIDWSNYEYSGKENQREGITSQGLENASSFASSSDIKQALVSALSKNQDLSPLLKDLSEIVFPSGEITTEIGDKLLEPILYGLSLISTNLNAVSGIDSSNQSMTLNQSMVNDYQQNFPKDYKTDIRKLIRMTPEERTSYMEDRDRFYRELDEWTDNTGDNLLPFSKRGVFALVSKNMREDREEYPWSVSRFVFYQDRWEASSHQTFKTKREAVRSLAEERYQYDSGIMFQNDMEDLEIYDGEIPEEENVDDIPAYPIAEPQDDDFWTVEEDVSTDPFVSESSEDSEQWAVKSTEWAKTFKSVDDLPPYDEYGFDVDEKGEVIASAEEWNAYLKRFIIPIILKENRTSFSTELDKSISEYADEMLPKIDYTGSEREKDETFIKSLDDENNLRAYMGLLGEILFLDTRITNAYVGQAEGHSSTKKKSFTVNKTIVDPYRDQRKRQNLKNTLEKVIDNKDVVKLAEYARSNEDIPTNTGVKKRALKELERNARFYRNAIGLIAGNGSNITPKTLFDYAGSSAVPDGNELNKMPISKLMELRDGYILENAYDSAVKRRDSGNMDKESFDYLVESIGLLSEQLNNAHAKIEELIASKDTSDKHAEELEDTLKSRDSYISMAFSDMSSAGDKLAISMNDLPSYKRYIALRGEKASLKSEGEYQADATAKGAREKGKELGRKIGTRLWIRDMVRQYPHLAPTGNYTMGTGLYNTEFRKNVENRLKEIDKELNEITPRLIAHLAGRIRTGSYKTSEELKTLKAEINRIKVDDIEGTLTSPKKSKVKKEPTNSEAEAFVNDEEQTVRGDTTTTDTTGQTDVDRTLLDMDALEGSAATKDTAFLEAMGNDDVLLNAMENIGARIFDGEVPLSDRFTELAIKAASEGLNALELDELRNSMANAPRVFRNYFGETLNRSDLVDSNTGSSSAMPNIETVAEGEKAFNLMERKRIARSLDLEDDELKDFLNGDQRLDGYVEEKLKNVEAQRKSLETEASKARAELEKAKKESESIENKLKDVRKQRASLKGKLDRSARREKEKDNTIADLEKREKELNRDLKKAKNSVERKEKEFNAYKQKVADKRKEERDYRAMRDYKERLVRSIFRGWNQNVDYRTVAPIMATVRELVDPKFRRDWFYDPINNPEGLAGGDTITLNDLQNLYNDIVSGNNTQITLNELQERIGARAFNRISGQGAKPLNDWTIKELEDLNEKVQAAFAEGREIQAAKKKAKRERRLNSALDIINTIKRTKQYKANSGNFVAGSIDDSPAKNRSSFKSFSYSTKRMQELAYLLDGDNGSRGEAYRLLVEAYRAARNIELRRIEERSRPIKDAIENRGRKEVSEFAYNTSFAVELEPGLSKNFTGSALMYVYLSESNPRAKEAIAFGNLVDVEEKGQRDADRKLIVTERLIADDDILFETGMERYNNLLTAAKNYIAINNMEDVVEAIRADFENKENGERLLNFSLDNFNAPIVLEEHYLPIKRMDIFSDQEMKSPKDLNRVTGDYLKKVEDGFLEEKRVINPRKQTAANLDLLQVWGNSVQDQEHLLAAGPLMSDIENIFESNAEVRDAIRRAFGKEMLDEIGDYLQYVVDPNHSDMKRDVSKVFQFLRGSVALSYLGFKVSGLLVQLITSPAPFIGETKGTYLPSAYMQVMAHPMETWRTVSSKSVMMAHRSSNMMIEEIKELSKDQNLNGWQKAWSRVGEVGMSGLEAVDKFCVMGGWLAKYNETIDDLSASSNMTTEEIEREAIKRADEMVLRTQPIGEKSENSRLFRSDNAILRIVLQFQSALNVVFNNLTTDLKYEWQTDQKRKVIGHVAGYALSGIALGLLRDGLGGDDEDDNKKVPLQIAYWALSQGLESAPIIGSALSETVSSVFTGEFNFNSGRTVLLPAFTDTVFGLARIGSAISGRDEGEPIDWGKVGNGTWQMFMGLGNAVGLPTSTMKQVKRAVEEKSLWPILGRY